MKKTKHKSSGAQVEIRCILVPVDFSEPSLVALQHALRMARQSNAQLLLLHVLEPFHADMFMDSTPVQRAVKTAAHERLASLVEETKKAWPRTGRELRSGHPVSTIISLAQRSKADIIVMGTHGRTGIRRAIIGSVAERVVRLAKCSVLVVR